MAEGTYRRESLRDVLLDRAEQVLTERGADALSLRELARDAGVSHGAPRNHFPDRAALLDALAARGLDGLAAALQQTLDETTDYPALVHAATRAGVGYAIGNPGLVGLMFTAKSATPSPVVLEAANRLSATITALTDRGVAEGRFAGFAPELLPLLVSGLMQGLSRIIVAGHVPPDRIDDLLDDAARLLLGQSRPTLPRG